MTVELFIPLKAKLKNGRQNQPLEPDKLYDVHYISTGQSYTTVYFENKDDNSVQCGVNSIHLDFYIKDRLVDIQRSYLFNPYIGLREILNGAPAICFMDED